MLALYQRERTGRGAHVGSSLIANGVWANGVWAQAALCGATFLPRPPREQSFNALACHYRCRDGGWLLLALVNEDKHWPVLAQCLGREELPSDPRFSSRSARSAHSAELIAILDQAFATRDSAEWRALFTKNGLVFEAVAQMSEIPRDPQMLETGVLRPFENDTLLTVDSPFFVTGAKKATARKPRRLASTASRSCARRAMTTPGSRNCARRRPSREPSQLPLSFRETTMTLEPLPGDFYNFQGLLTREEQDIVARVRTFFQEKVAPIANDAWAAAEFQFDLIPGSRGAGHRQALPRGCQESADRLDQLGDEPCRSVTLDLLRRALGACHRDRSKFRFG